MSLNEKISALDQEILSSMKEVSIEDPIDHYLFSPFALPWTRLFIALHVKPNAVTILGMIFGLSCGHFIYLGGLKNNLIALLLIYLSIEMDAVDGQVARRTGAGSLLGRVLDGAESGFMTIGIYSAFCLRLMSQPIPYLGTYTWGWKIWPIALFSGFVCCLGQCRSADYARQVHLMFLNGREHSELARTCEITEHLNSLPKKGRFLEKRFYRSYYSYTRSQEKETPAFQKFFNNLTAKYGSDIPTEIRKDWVTESHKLVWMQNFLTMNYRTLAAVVSLFTGCYYIVFAFEILLMSIVRSFMLSKYENLSRKLNTKYFNE